MTVRWGMLAVVVRPYSLRPSPATKNPISAAASASASARPADLPVSATTSSAASSRRACNARARSRTSAPRSTGVRAAHAGCASPAASTAAATSPTPEREATHSSEPSDLRPPFEVFEALAATEPDVAIVNDWRALGWAALQARQAGLALTRTAFIVHCHGPGRVLVEFAQKVPDTLERFGETVAERAALELADAVVSPSAWLVDWFRSHRWTLPESVRVIQYIRQSAALGKAVTPVPNAGPIRRLAFFGQLREGKGIRIFLDALDQLEPVEVVFLGAASKRWPPQELTRRVPGARVEHDLTREAALAELREPGTLAVMPSLLDNSPNTVAECIEHGIPFVATATGGIAELIAEEERARVLCAPTAGELAAALSRAVGAPHFAAARPAHEPAESLRAWLELIATVAPKVPPPRRAALRVGVVAGGGPSFERARRLAAATRSVEVEVT